MRHILPALALFLCANTAFADAADRKYIPSDGAGNGVVPGAVTGYLDTNGNFVPASAANPVPTAAGNAAPSATTNKSGAITTGGTFQTLIAANTSRKSFEVQNICNVAAACTATTNLCYVYVAASGTATTSDSIVLGPGQSYLRSAGAVPSDIVKVTCAGTGDKIYASEQ